MRISDWSSDVCSSDLIARGNSFCDERLHVSTTQHSFNVLGMAFTHLRIAQDQRIAQQLVQGNALVGQQRMAGGNRHHERITPSGHGDDAIAYFVGLGKPHVVQIIMKRSEEHTSELQSLMRISYAVFGLKKK